MNHNDNHVYTKPPAMRPMDMYSVKSQINNQLNLTVDSLVNLGQVTNDHAIRIDELRKDLEDMKALFLWIADAHPDVIKQYYAVADIARASK
jgi:hypothetical protein